MDMLSIIALGKANKALKNGGGSTESSITYYEFTIETGGGGYPVVTTDATVAAILEDISNGKLPVAIANYNSTDSFAYVSSYDASDVVFQTLPSISSTVVSLWKLNWDSHDEQWNWEQMLYPDNID